MRTETATQPMKDADDSRELVAKALEQMWSHPQSWPTGLLLEGEAGIGKTTLWLDGAEKAAQAGFSVLSTCGSPAEVQSSYAALADVLDRVDISVISALPTAQQRAVDSILMRGDEQQSTEQRLVASAFLHILELLAQQSPVVLALDDVQWLDGQSRDVIGFALRRTRAAVAVLASARSGEAGTAEVGSWLRMSRPEALSRIVLGPMSQRALHDIVLRRLGRTVARTTMSRVHQFSGGNPFYAIEFVRALDEHSDGHIPMPASLTALISERLNGVDDAMSNLLLAIATASRPTTALLADVLDSPAATIEQLLVSAEERDLIEFRSGTWRFTHPLLAHGVYSNASPATRRAMHRRLGTVERDQEISARHLALAAIDDDTELVAALDAAADAAAGRGAPGAAAELLELALSVGGDQVWRRVRAAELYFRAGSTPSAGRVLPDDAFEIPAGPLRAMALMLTGAVHAYHDDLAAAATVMALGVEEAHDAPALQTRGAIRLALALHMLGRQPEALQRLHAAVAVAEELAIPSLHSQALSMLVTSRFVAGLGVDLEALQLAVELEDPADDSTTWFRATAVQAMISAWTGDLRGARKQMAEVGERMRAAGTELDIIWATNHLSMIDVWLGRYTDAYDAAAESLERASHTGSKQLLVSAWNVQAEVAARMGREDEARTAAASSLTTTRRTAAAQMALAATAALAFLEVSLGNYAAALEVMEPLLERFDPAHDTELVPGSYLPDAIEALIVLGCLERADLLVRALETNGARHERAWMRAVGARGRAQLCAARGDLTAADEALQDALSHHSGLPMPFELARTQLVLGQVLRRRRRIPRAIEVLDEAVTTFESLGSPLWAQRARDERSRLSGVRGDGRALSRTERHVAVRAAAGSSNREIAAELCVAVKTVEANLSKVYRKLGVRSRAGLANALAAELP